MSDRLRILFVTEDDPLYVIRFFEVFFDEYPKHEFEIVGLTADAAFHESMWRTARRMFRFYGPVDFVRLCVRFAGVKLRRTSIVSLAQAHGIAIVPCASVNDPDYVTRVRRLGPDVIVSVAAPEIFRQDILASAQKRCINIHSGRLPKYRGMMPNFWQLLHGEAAATVTVHDMVERLDSGGIVRTLEFPLKEPDTLDRVITGTKREGARLMIEALRGIAAGEAPPPPLDMTDKDYFSFPRPDDVRKFRARGHRML